MSNFLISLSTVSTLGGLFWLFVETEARPLVPLVKLIIELGGAA